MLTDNDDQRPSDAFVDLDEMARQGRCAMIWWFSQATILLPMQFQYPEQVHEQAGQRLTDHVDAEARRRIAEKKEQRQREDSERFHARVEAYLAGEPLDGSLAASVAEFIRTANRSRLRCRSYAQLAVRGRARMRQSAHARLRMFARH